MELALACDLTVASEECLFGAPEVRFGSGIVAMLLPWLAGPKNAKYLLLSGDDRVTARSALDMGLINRVVPVGQALDQTLELARRVAANDALAVKLTKQAINRSLDIGGLREALRQAFETNVSIETSESAESREFNAILKRDGAKAAIAWRSQRASGRSADKNP
jgi:enoyl-CoA hydratase